MFNFFEQDETIKLTKRFCKNLDWSFKKYNDRPGDWCYVSVGDIGDFYKIYYSNFSQQLEFLIKTEDYIPDCGLAWTAMSIYYLDNKGLYVIDEFTNDWNFFKEYTGLSI